MPKATFNVVFNGQKKEFSLVLANWLAKDAKWWEDGEEPQGTVPNDWNLRQLAEIMGEKDASHLLWLLQLMVNNRIMFESMIAFAARYRTAVGKATVEDVQRALDLIKVMEVQGS